MTNLKKSSFLLALLASSSLYAADPLVSREYEFKPNQPQPVDNPFFWQLSVSCAITSTDPQNLLVGVMKRKSAKINGVLLNEGDQTSVLVKNHDTLYIVADSGARVEITNHGPSLVKAKCST